MQPTLMDILLGLLPFLVLMGAIYLMWRVLNGPGSPGDRQAKALERIADALEKRQ